MTATTYALDALTRHQIYLQRYSTGEINKILPILEQLSQDLASTITSGSVTEFQFERLSLIKRDIDALISAAISELNDQLMLDINDLAKYESQFTTKLLNSMITIDAASVTVEQAMSVITSTPMRLTTTQGVDVLTIDQAIAGFSRAAARDVTTVIQTGIIEGQTSTQIAKKVSDMVDTRTQAQASALVRTTLNHTGTMAREATYQANSDILEGEIYTATLDGRTTLECASLDGNIYSIGQGPQPPIHWGCRSVRIPKVKDEFTLSSLTGKRASVDGPVDARTTFPGWFSRQSADFQKEYLGLDRYKLYKKGGLKLDRFIDDFGVEYSIDDLRRLEPQAFEKAGL